MESIKKRLDNLQNSINEFKKDGDEKFVISTKFMQEILDYIKEISNN